MQMSTFDLFDKIEDSAVLLQPHGDVDMKKIEKMTMEKVNAKKVLPMKRRRSLGVYLLAAVLATFLLATTAFAYVGFTQYENPGQMLNTFFGNAALPSVESMDVEMSYYDKEYTVTWPEVQRVPLDEEVAEEAAPPISAVGQSVTVGDQTITVVAHQHDTVLGTGTVYFTVEDPEGVSGYKTQRDGEIWWPLGELIRLNNCQHKNYIISGETTDTKISVACYYVGANWYGEDSIEAHFAGTNKVIQLPLSIFEATDSLSSKDSAVTLTSIGMQLQLAEMDFLYRELENGTMRPPLDDCDIDYIAVRFADGSEYVVDQDKDGELIANASYICGTDVQKKGMVFSYLFNRIIDLEQVEAVIVNDTEYVLS